MNLNLNQTLLLYLIQQANDRIEGRTRLQKMVFMVECKGRESEVIINFNYDFFRWNYGPFSTSLLDDMRILATLGYVQIDNYSDPMYSTTEYSLTEEGKLYLNTAELDIGNIQETIDDIAKQYSSKDLKSILQEVYSKANVKEYQMGDVILPRILEGVNEKDKCEF